jgi:hypothetical protein
MYVDFSSAFDLGSRTFYVKQVVFVVGSVVIKLADFRVLQFCGIFSLPFGVLSGVSQDCLKLRLFADCINIFLFAILFDDFT